MAESNAMDRAQISALLDRTQRVLTLAAQAQEALRLLSIKQVVQVTSKGELGPDGNVSLIAPSTIVWPENLFASVFVDGLHAETTIKNFLASMAVVPGLYQQVRSAQGGLLSRLFNPFKSQAGDQAAFDLMVKLDELSPQGADVSRLVEGVHAARARQAQGVEIFSGVHGLGERYLESARTQLAGALGISTPHFESWDAAKLSQARRVVQRYSNDPNSEFRLKSEAEKCLDDLNAQRVEILLVVMLL